jgi:acetylglutamate kinase
MQLTLVKIGGHVLDKQDTLDDFLSQFADVDGYKILVHGGGKKASAISSEMGIPPNIIDGRRITDEATLEIVTMVYGGLINKNLVAKLLSLGCNAAGISGADGNLLPAHKRSHPTIDFGWVGDIDGFNPGILDGLLANIITPVVAPLTHDGNGHLLNTNADTIASSIATGLARRYAITLVYCFEQKGLLRDIDRPNDVITGIKEHEIQPLIDSGVISGGMIPKVHNIRESLKNGIKRVILCHALDLKKVLSDPDSGTGTIFTL